ncbi:MAG TPA: SpoIIE family protein phosphatase [Bacteroidales bacterium]|nr:SpoIIE family protein phosphatase [Bacteroidales bacterium]HPF03662.1 SpoIIE family protein phosphatase [Bacteroidales bacterium]HPJ60643.1 SpoIIE family protein phosphatase [Bacteroidales bacterium]HPR13560.1 SpoIIE family protein phosphatase [Bacteroidales bacterium]HRW84342.1 SpoIIE family protein phosphatase [Bacteroidales bacterium]
MEFEEFKNSDLVSLVQNQVLDDHFASLRYAGIIQKALMPDPGILKGLLSDFFVLFLPRDIVSGDFYYVLRNRQNLCIAAGDCTGHGVPGALLSILGISFLNEIFQSRADMKANRVLNMMREKVMKALHQTGEKSGTKDSIDIGLCIVDTKSGIMQFSGANRPLIMVRNGELTEFKPDKMTIGLAPLAEHPFTNQIIETSPGDSFYLFSDGYADQFGELTDKKFKYKHLRRVILSMAGLPMELQRDALETTFMEWKGKVQQVDDVLVFGFQL